MTTTTEPAKTKIGDFLVWFSHEHNGPRIGERDSYRDPSF